MQCMLDLETMSVRSNASIASIGCVKWKGKEIIDTFYCTVDIKTCLDVGLHIDKRTVEWWSKQNKEALSELRKNNIPLKDALNKFSDWLNNKKILIWGNGAGFDNVILANAYFACDIELPWLDGFNDRCYRTINKLIQIPEEPRVGTYHNALDDALHQTKHLIKILES